MAARQRGCISRWQLLAAGIGDRTIYNLCARGHLIRLHRGVFAVGHAGPRSLAAETAALLACGAQALLSHHSAGLLWKIIPERVSDGTIHITVPGRHGGQPKGVRVHRTQTLHPREIRVVEGLSVTSPARTLLDLASVLEARDLERAVDEALLQRLVSRSALEQTASQANGRRGAAGLAGTLARHRTPRVTRSEAERKFLALIRAARLPEPQCNIRLHGFEVDFYWPAQKLVVEIDGYRYHSSRPAFERDSAKGATMVAAGLQFMRITWLQMEADPLIVVSRVAQAVVRGEA